MPHQLKDSYSGDLFHRGPTVLLFAKVDGISLNSMLNTGPKNMGSMLGVQLRLHPLE